MCLRLDENWYYFVEYSKKSLSICTYTKSYKSGYSSLFHPSLNRWFYLYLDFSFLKPSSLWINFLHVMGCFDTVFAEVPIALVTPPSLEFKLVSLMKIGDATETSRKGWFSSVTDPSYPLVFFDLLDLMHMKVNLCDIVQVLVLPAFWVISSKGNRVYF